MDQKLEKLQALLDGCRSAVFFGGAGVSTESGLADFRSPDGLYHQKYAYPPEYMLSHECFEEHPEDFFRFYREKLLCPDAKPNAAHFKLAELETAGRLSAVVTQNIDGLHQAAGSRTVWELHGSVKRNHCARCGRRYDGPDALPGDGVPRCECGGIIRPDVVLYGEGLDPDVISGAIEAIRGADLLLIGGTSLAVYPAAGLVRYYRGRELVLINRDPTPMDGEATLVINDSIGKTLSAMEVR